MRRADRLFQIIQTLKKRRTATAAFLAEKLEVSKRTIYRDIQDLILSGTPIEGEAGVGYMLSKYYDFPPLMFTEDEIEALVLGARFVKQWADKGLAKAAENILSKVESVLPEELKNRIENSPLFTPNLTFDHRQAEVLHQLRNAITRHRKLNISYHNIKGKKSERIVRPLGLAYMGPTWLLTTWCDLRKDFRNFRVDRIIKLTVLEETFPVEPGKTLDDFFKTIR